MIALIPARVGSKRVPGKNFKELGGIPLVDWTIIEAIRSGIFDRIIVSTDDNFTHLNFAFACAPLSVYLRPSSFAQDDSPDIGWVRHALATYASQRLRPISFAILRPTSPFRTAETIQRAYREFNTPDATLDSLRAVEPVRQHPGKMWTWQGEGFPIRPVLDFTKDGTPWHSMPTQSLPTYYVQNSSLEMSYTSNVETFGTISGRKIAPFFTRGYEGFTIDYPDDWAKAEALVASGAVQCPTVDLARVSATSQTQ